MFKKFKKKHWVLVTCTLGIAVATVVGAIALRAKRSYSVLRDWQAQVRHQIATGGTIGAAPASKTFEASYLDAIFGGEPELLAQTRMLIAKGLQEDPTLNLGEVTALVATYTKSPQGKVEEVAIHVLGGFEVGKRRPGFNRDGFFASQIDRNLFATGNNLIGLLGRDMIVFADPQTSHKHDAILESVLSGDIMPLVGSITNQPFHYIAVFPEPRRVMPTQLRPHISACIFKGHLSPYKGDFELDILTKEPRSASYTLAVMNDLKIAAQIGLRTRLDGVVHKTAWGNHVSTWWAYQMAELLDDATLEKQQTQISMKAEFQRTMVNATLKTIERFGRDMAILRMIRDDRLDPRLVDEKLKSSKPLNYWSEPHKWGPDWPFAPVSTNAAPIGAAEIAPTASAPVATPQI